MNIFRYAPLLAFFVLASFGLCFSQPDLGALLPNKSKFPTEFALVSAGSINKVYLVPAKGMVYQVAINEYDSIYFIATTDRSFTTSENVKIGTTLGELRRLLKDVEVVHEAGWAKYVKLPSGWNGAFQYEYALTEDSKVLFFFKRR